MKKSSVHYLLIEPYYGGSHRVFLKGLQKHVPFDFTLLSLPARKWKMRMQLSAPWFAQQVKELVEAGNRFDGILCSTFIDSALLKTILHRENIHLPLLVYFHENQFAYPNQVDDVGKYQFTSLNFTSAIAADGLAFNSRYNLETFIHGVSRYLKKAADIKLIHLVDELLAKSEVLYPGIDFKPFDSDRAIVQNNVPVVVWNHRWEHDKDPDTFFGVLCKLSARNIPFRLIVLGQSFSRKPPVFRRAKEKLQNHILHFGFVRSRKEYARFLSMADIVVSTARHEFFGMAVLEAVRSGCVPVVPDRLAYCELFPRKYRYQEGSLLDFLENKLEGTESMQPENITRLTGKYSWPTIAPKYEKWLCSVL